MIDRIRGALAASVGLVGAQLRRGLGAHELALAIAVGAACAFFPILGLATPLCLAAAAVLRLNHAVVQAVNALTSPLYPAAVLGFAALGAALARSPVRSFALTSFIVHALLGWVVAAAIAAPLLYLVTRLIRAPYAIRRAANGELSRPA